MRQNDKCDLGEWEVVIEEWNSPRNASDGANNVSLTFRNKKNHKDHFWLSRVGEKTFDRLCTPFKEKSFDYGDLSLMFDVSCLIVYEKHRTFNSQRLFINATQKSALILFLGKCLGYSEHDIQQYQAAKAMS